MAPYIISSYEEGIVHDQFEMGVLLQRDSLTRIDVIDAMEFVGAFYLGKEQPTPYEVEVGGFWHWRRALTLRLMDTEDCRPIYKTPLKSKSGQLSEWMTMDDLERIEQQPAQRKIQSFLVRLRILSRIGWSAVRDHFIPGLLHFLHMELPHLDSMTEILDLIWLTVDIILRSERPHESSVFDFFENIVHQLFANFNDMPKDDPKLNSENLTKFVDLVLMMDQSYLTDPKLEAPVVQTRQMKMFKLMFFILLRHPELITEEIRLSLFQLVRRDVRDPSGFSLLYYACFTRHDVNLPIIRFLVQLGANLNARNMAGDGILHILALKPASETMDATGRLLVELGVHLDMANNEGLTAADLWFLKNTPEKRDVADLPDWLKETEPRALQCFCSRVIRRHKLPYDDGAILPVELVPFVSLH